MSTPSDLAGAIRDLAAKLAAATVAPADALRFLADLADFAPETVASSAPIGAAMAMTESAVGDLCRRTAVIALARAAAQYEPSSYDDAAGVRRIVCDLLDAEITVAGDRGEDASYEALRTLKAAVARDLTTRGADLARIVTVGIPGPLPALALADRLYQDAGRAEELAAAADPPHPAFMPVSFKALSE